MKLIVSLIFAIFFAAKSHANSQLNSYYMKTIRYSFVNLTQEILIKYSLIDDRASSKIFNFKNSNWDQRIESIISLIDKINNGFQEGDPELNIALTSNSNWRSYINKINDNWQLYKRLILQIDDRLDQILLDKFIELDQLLFDEANDSVVIYESKSNIAVEKLITILKILARNFYLINLGKNTEEVKEISKQMLDDFESIFFTILVDNNIKSDLKEINELWERIKIIYEISIYADSIPKDKLVKQINMNYQITDKIFALKKYENR